MGDCTTMTGCEEAKEVANPHISDDMIGEEVAPSNVLASRALGRLRFEPQLSQRECEDKRSLFSYNTGSTRDLILHSQHPTLHHWPTLILRFPNSNQTQHKKYTTGQVATP